MRVTASRAVLIAMIGLGSLGSAVAQNLKVPGVTDTEIVLGQTQPYSGAAAAYSVYGRVETAYFAKINDDGGVSGHKIKLISLDDAYSPPRTVEQTRKLVEQDEVLAIFGSTGTPTNLAIRKYLNAKEVPHIVIGSGSSLFADPKHFPWSMGWQPGYNTEGKIWIEHILRNKPDAKIAMLYQNDEYGKDYVRGIKERLGELTGKMMVSEQTYESTEPTVDTQIISAKGSGADVFFIIATPKYAAQAIRKAYDIGWKPTEYIVNGSTSLEMVLKPAGLEKTVGLITANFMKDPSDPRWADDQGLKEYREFLSKYLPGTNVNDVLNVYGYSQAQIMVQILKQCNGDFSRQNLIKQATDLHGIQLPMLIPGVVLNTSPDDYSPLKSMQILQFNGERWVPMGEVIKP